MSLLGYLDYLHMQKAGVSLLGYLDYLHMQKVKAQQPARLKLAEVNAALAPD